MYSNQHRSKFSLTMATHLLITLNFNNILTWTTKAIFVIYHKSHVVNKLETNIETHGPLLKKWEPKQEHSQATLNSQRH